MRLLLNGCAAAALAIGLAGAAHAQVEVRTAPIHAIPADDAAPAPAEQSAAQAVAETPAPAPPPVEARVVRALAPQPQVQPALTAEENAFFDALGHRVTDAASAYESYVRRASGIDARFEDGVAVQKALQAGAAYHPGQLQEGVVAYAALLALREQSFVDGVRASDPALADRLARQPELVMTIPGADVAAAGVAGVLRAQGQALIAAGRSISQAAYDVQAESWSKSAAPGGLRKLVEAKASAATVREADPSSEKQLLQSLVNTPAAPDEARTSTPEVVRGLALAALAVLGRTGDKEEAAFQALLQDGVSADCLKMAKLNLNQCLAVAGPEYEDVYCLGRHAVSDTGQCLAAAADAAAPSLTRIDAEPRAPRPYAEGREQASAYGRPYAVEQGDDDDAAPPRAPAPAPYRYSRVDPNLYAGQPYRPAPNQYAGRPDYDAQDDAPAPQAYYAPPQQPAYRYSNPAPTYAPPAPPQPYGQPAQGYYAQPYDDGH
jgi:hypothetical protein